MGVADALAKSRKLDYVAAKKRPAARRPSGNVNTLATASAARVIEARRQPVISQQKIPRSRADTHQRHQSTGEAISRLLQLSPLQYAGHAKGWPAAADEPRDAGEGEFTGGWGAEDGAYSDSEEAGRC